jgi:hypothetical protein
VGEWNTYASYEEIGRLLSLKNDSARPIHTKHKTILDVFDIEEELTLGLSWHEMPE